MDDWFRRKISNVVEDTHQQLNKAAEGIANRMTDEQKSDLMHGRTSVPEVIFHDTLQQKFDYGKAPNAGPAAEPRQDYDLRPIVIASHPVKGGSLARWISEQGTSGTSYPDPTFHWAVVVGGFYHELNAAPGALKDGELTQLVNYYQNDRVSSDKWNGQSWGNAFQVGMTRFNDEAIRRAAEDVMANKMKNRYYNLLDNNCQCFANKLVDAICDPSSSRRQAISISVAVDSNGLKVLSENVVKYEGGSPAEAAAVAMAKETQTVNK